MRVRVLGASGSGLRSHALSSFLVDGHILLDAGAIIDTLDLNAQQRIDCVFVTHAHLDHVRDIPFLAGNAAGGKRKNPITVFGIKEVIRDIKRHILNKRIWPDFTLIPSETEPILALEEIKGSVCLDGILVTAYPVNHTVPATGFLLEKNGTALFYTGDTGPTRKTWKRLRGKRLDCLIMEISYPDRLKDLALRTGHLSPSLFLEQLSLLEPKPKRTFVTHIKARYKREIEMELKALSLSRVHILSGGETIRI